MWGADTLGGEGGLRTGRGGEYPLLPLLPGGQFWEPTPPRHWSSPACQGPHVNQHALSGRTFQELGGHLPGPEAEPGGSQGPAACLASAPAAACLEHCFSAFGFLLNFPPQGWVLWLPLCLCCPTLHVLALIPSSFCCLEPLSVYLFGFDLSPPSRT